MRIGIYPGSFDPVHKEHIKIVKTILEQKIVDRVLIVPTGDYWQKNIKANLAHRINMLKLYETENIKIETSLNDTKSTYELFEKLKEIYIRDSLYLVIGGDNLRAFDKWINYKKMLEHPFIIVERCEYNKNLINKKMKEFNKDNYNIININSSISSSDVRQAFSKGELTSSIDDKVLTYIKENKLYK